MSNQMNIQNVYFTLGILVTGLDHVKVMLNDETLDDDRKLELVTEYVNALSDKIWDTIRSLQTSG